MAITQKQDWLSDGQDLANTSGSAADRFSENVIKRPAGFDFAAGTELHLVVKRNGGITASGGTIASDAVVTVTLISNDTVDGNGEFTTGAQGEQVLGTLPWAATADAPKQDTDVIDAKIDPKKIKGRHLRLKFNVPARVGTSKIDAFFGPPFENQFYVESASKV